MSYLVLARKWRPQTFDDVIGQDPVVTTLKNAISMNRVAHAYLFSGPRGVGKTSTARIFAKALNCKKGPTDKPCNTCIACTEIAGGSSLDILEIDGASNRGIDQVRELRDNAKFAPTSCRYKIYIIDEVHMLTTEAFNALLKTLEEPPAHVKFFFATTESHKVPSTILSRCQRFDLRKISTKEVFESLKNIVKSEKIKADDKTLYAVAKGADGSLRDSQSLLDQLISFSAGELKYEDALQILGWVPRESVIGFFDALKKGEWKGLFDLIRQIDLDGKDLGSFSAEVASHLRDLLILQIDPKESELVELAPENLAQVQAQTRLFTKDQLLQMLETALDVQDRMKFALSKRSMVEALAVRLHLISQSASVEDLMAKVEALKSGDLKASTAGSMMAQKPAGFSVPKSSENNEVKKKDLNPLEVSEASPSTESSGPLPVSDDAWGKVLERIGKTKPLIQAYLKEAVPVWEGKNVKLLFPSNRKFYVDSLQAPEYQSALRREIGQAYGIDAALEFGVLPCEPAESAGPTEGTTSAGVTGFQDDPVVQKALEMFQGKITEIKR